MRQSSIIIHKGKREEKYEIYVEDYVISYLKEKADSSERQEVLFYGCREKGGRQYTIYGAGQDRHLAVFDKYDLLEEIGCRLTETGPVFFVKETDGTYDVKGYKVFYYENEEMQDYLIHRDIEKKRKTSLHDTYIPDGQAMPCVKAAGSREQSVREKHFYVVSLQLGFVFLILTAIVINSANSYDKMRQLNQSAEEVFFVMENQEAEGTAGAANEVGSNDIVVERDAAEDNILRDNVLQENTLSEQESENGETAAELVAKKASENPEGTKTGEDDGAREGAGEEITEAWTESDTVDNGTDKQPDEDAQKESAEEQPENDKTVDTEDKEGQAKTELPQKAVEVGGENNDGVEALSRNVARYYEVERGDTLYMISQKMYGDTSHVKKICEINQISDPDSIRYGQKIILP